MIGIRKQEGDMWYKSIRVVGVLGVGHISRDEETLANRFIYQLIKSVSRESIREKKPMTHLSSGGSVNVGDTVDEVYDNRRSSTLS